MLSLHHLCISPLLVCITRALLLSTVDMFAPCRLPPLSPQCSDTWLLDHLFHPPHPPPPSIAQAVTHPLLRQWALPVLVFLDPECLPVAITAAS